MGLAVEVGWRGKAWEKVELEREVRLERKARLAAAVRLAKCNRSFWRGGLFLVLGSFFPQQ